MGIRARFVVVFFLGAVVGAVDVGWSLTADQPARIVRPGEVVRLEVRDAPAGAQVSFVLPEGGAGGSFADGSVVAEAVASAAGTASVNFTAADSAGVFLADATLDGAGESVSFAVTVLPVDEELPAIGPGEARAAAEALATAGQAVHGPVLAPAGTEVRAPVPAVVFDRNAPFVAAEDAWLAWVDTEPGVRFGHLTRWVTVDAETGAVRAIYQDWWPELRMRGAAGEALPLLGASRANRRAPVSLELPGSPMQGATDACLVGVIGARLPAAVDDMNEVAGYVAGTANVAVDSVRFGRTAGQVLDALRTASDAGCQRLFLLVSAHAGQARGGGVLLEAEDGVSYLTYAQLAEWLAPFEEVEAILAASFAEEAASWFDGRELNGVVLASAFAQGAAARDPVGRLLRAASGTMTLAEAHQAAFADGSAPPPHTIAPEGSRRMWLSDVDLYDAGSQQRIDVTRPLNIDLGPTLIYNASVEDEDTAGFQTKVFVLPSDQDLLRFAFGGRRRGETRYRITMNDSAQQVYTTEGRIEIGSFTAAPDGVVLRTGGAPATVTIERHGFWSRRGAPTAFHAMSRDESVAVPAEAVVEIAANTAAIELRPVGAGTTYLDLWDATARKAASIAVEVLGPPDLNCPTQGSATVVYTVAAGGDPAGFAPRVALGRGMLYWRREGGRIELWGDKAPMLSAVGIVMPDCRFSAAGASGQERVAGVTGLGAVYENGRISLVNGEIAFDYRLGPFDAGQTVTYAAAGVPTAHAGPLGSGALYAKQTGGERSVAVGVGDGVAWTASSDADWLRLGREAGVGPGLLRFLVTPNGSSARRTGTLTAAGERLTVTQAAGPDLGEPLVTGVVNGATFQEGAAAGSWLTISGFGLADETRTWFTEPAAGVGQTGGPLPTSLAGVSVRINGLPAYVQFVSPGQINVLAPEDATVGRVEVEVDNNGRVSAPVQVAKREIAPELFRFQPREGRYPAAVHPDGTLAGPNGLFRTVATRAAKPGDVVLLFGSGFGATDPPTLAGVLVTQAAPLAAPVAASIGGLPAEVLFGGLVGAGLFQFNVVVPELPPGDHLIELWSAGRALESTAFLRVE